MFLIRSLKLVILLFVLNSATGQMPAGSLRLEREFVSLEEALKNPEKVYRLNLSDQNIEIPKETWLKFTNLEYLSLKNDHLMEIPNEIGYLKNLKTLDLSGNDFVSLPKTFKNLTNLEEIFLNDESRFVLDKSIPVLKDLPNLKTMHLENDALVKLPKNFYKMDQLETLYLNNNRFVDVPKEIQNLRKLKFVDFHDNKIKLDNSNVQNPGFGFKIVY